jgi:Planctomycete cytochrome C
MTSRSRVLLRATGLVGLPVLLAPLWWVLGSPRPANDRRPPAPPSEGPGPQGEAAPTAEAEAFFDSKVRPVLDGTCFRCHGEKVRGSLRLESRAALVRGGDHGPAVVPGDAEKSLLIQAVRYAHPDVKMPRWRLGWSGPSRPC